jgi:ribosomal protein L40E
MSKDRGNDRADREKNERVIHTRVPERLEAELKERAESLGVSVSNLVRNVLTNTFGLVEGIVADSARVAFSARSGLRHTEPTTPAPARAAAPDPSPTSSDDIVGWQEMILNKNAVCDRCNAILPRGGDAAIAIAFGNPPRAIVCPRCLEEIRHGRDRRDVRDPDGDAQP